MERLAFRLGERRVDLRSARVASPLGEAALSPIEVKLLAYLGERPGQIIARDELLQRVWGYRPGVRSRTIDNTVRRLREKIEPDPAEPVHLHSIYGQGLRLDGVAADADGPTSAFVGRRADLDALRRALDDSARVVTVLGPAGVGKSRLVRELLATIPGRTVFAEIGAQDPDSAVALALGLAGVGSAETAVRTALAGREPLVLALDECELQVDAVSARLDRWSRPGLQVVVTSRRPLGRADEQRLTLGPLAEDDALDLFCARTRERDLGIAPDRDALRPFVRAVDGLPLAIELGAARFRAAGPDGLAALGARGMDAALEPTLRSLVASHREVLTSLATFEAPFTLPDAAAVADRPEERTVEALAALLDHGLVRVVETSPPRRRYALYAVVREHVRVEGHPAELRHAQWFSRLGTYQRSELSRSDPALREEHRGAVADLRAAFERTREVDPETAARCAYALLMQYGREGPASLSVPLLSRVEGLACSPRTRASIGHSEAILHIMRADVVSAVEAIDRALPFATDPDLRVELLALRSMSRGPRGGEDLEQARPLLDRAGTARAQYHNAAASLTSDYRTAQDEILACARVARRYGDAITEARALSIAGHNAVWQGEWEVARRYLDRALAQVEALGLPTRTRGLAWFLLGQLVRLQGDPDRAEELQVESIAHGEALGDLDGVARSRIELGLIEISRGDSDAAVALLDRALPDGGDRPNHVAQQAWTAIAEAELARGRLPAARAALEEALGHAVGGIGRAAALELVAVVRAIDGDADGARAALAESDAPPAPGAAGARHEALAALVEARVGSIEVASARLAEAESRAERLGVGPLSPVARWIEQAAVAAGVRTGQVLPGPGR